MLSRAVTARPTDDIEVPDGATLTVSFADAVVRVVGCDGLTAVVERLDEWKVVGEASGVASDLVAVIGAAV